MSGLPADRCVEAALSRLREECGADAAMVLRDTGTDHADVIWADPGRRPIEMLRIDSELREAMAAGDPAFSLHPGGLLAETVLAYGVARAAAILPVAAPPEFAGAVVLLWADSIDFDGRMRDFFRSVMFLLGAIVPQAVALQKITAERDWICAMLEALPRGVAFLERRGQRAWLNIEAAGILGLSPGAIDPEMLRDAMHTMRMQAEPGSEARDAPAEDGSRTWVILTAERRLFNIMERQTLVHGISGRLWIFSDTTEQRRMEDELRASEDRYRELFENSPLPGWVYDVANLAIVAVNGAAISQYGYSRDEFLRMTLPDLLKPEETPTVMPGLAMGEETHQRSGPWVHRKRDGTVLLVEVYSQEVRFSGRRARLVMMNDITERRVAEQRLREQEERWQLALRGNNDGLWDYDVRHNEVFFSRRWKEMLGYEEHELANHPREWELRVHPEDLPHVLAKLSDHLRRKSPYYVAEYRLRCKDGSYKWVLARGQAVWDGNGQPLRMVGSHTDITERKHAEEQLTRDALYDSLTGLLNRRHFLEELERAIRRAEEKGLALSVALGDLDLFKSINDSHGHSVGDEVLSVFGAIAQQSLRRDDFAGRIGGDEFCLVFPQSTVSEAAAAADRTRIQMAATAIGVKGGNAFYVSVTFGVAEWKSGQRAKDLLETADQMLYRAKELGRNRVVAIPG